MAMTTAVYCEGPGVLVQSLVHEGLNLRGHDGLLGACRDTLHASDTLADDAGLAVNDIDGLEGTVLHADPTS